MQTWLPQCHAIQFMCRASHKSTYCIFDYYWIGQNHPPKWCDLNLNICRYSLSFIYFDSRMARFLLKSYWFFFYLQQAWSTLFLSPVNTGWTCWCPWALWSGGTSTSNRTRSWPLSGTKVFYTAGWILHYILRLYLKANVLIAFIFLFSAGSWSLARRLLGNRLLHPSVCPLCPQCEWLMGDAEIFKKTHVSLFLSCINQQ